MCTLKNLDTLVRPRAKPRDNLLRRKEKMEHNKMLLLQVANLCLGKSIRFHLGEGDRG